MQSLNEELSGTQNTAQFIKNIEMNYALKTLMNQSDLITKEIDKVQKAYDECHIESVFDIEMFETDLCNLKKQQSELVHAIELLKPVI